MKAPNISLSSKLAGAALAMPFFSLALPASEGASKWASVGGSVGGLILGVVQLVVGLSLAAFSINKGLQLLSKLLGGLDIWAEIKAKNSAVALLAAGVVVSYTRVIAGGIDAMTSSLSALSSADIFGGVVGLVAGLINLVAAICVASFAITVVFRVMDKLTASIDEKAEFKSGNVAIGIIYCGILIGVSSLVAAGVSGIGAAVSYFLNALVNAFIG